MNIPVLRIKDENGQYQDIPAIKGAKGDKGDPGTNGVNGGYYEPSVSSSGDLSWTPSKSGMPDVATSNIKGPQGEQGPTGQTGPKGDTPNVTVGTTTTSDPGGDASVTKNSSSTEDNAIFDFVIPRGEQGPQGNPGSDGKSPTVNVGTTTTGPAGSQASVTNSGTETDAVFNFTIPVGIQGQRGEKGDTGDTGATPSINVGTTTTGNPGTEASVTKDKSSTETNVIFDFTIPRGDKGETGSVGPQGPTGPTGATFTPSVSGEGIISWTNDKGLDNPSSVDIKGPQGDRGPQGETGPQGQSATIEVGSTVTSQPGSKASVTNSGTSSAAVFNFTIPEGQKGNPGNDGEKGDPGAVFTPSVSDEGIISWTNNGDLPNPTSVNIRGPQGIQGSKGDAATVSVGETTTVDPGTEASVTNSGTSSAAVFNFSIPKGEKGDQGIQGNKGDPGEAATIEIGTTTTGLPGSQASVTNSGTSEKAVFNFSIPKGEKGNTGDTGPRGEAATVSVGTTTTGDPGGSASVTNSGTSSDAVFNFVIPRGQQGTPGQDGSPGLYVGNSAPSDANIRLWVKPVDDYVFSYSNPNLLINSNFIDPINQRGETTYSGNAYGIDRWKGATVGSSIGISGSGVFITGQITQYVEMKSSNIGRTMTMSSCDSNGNIKSITGELDTSSVSGNNMSFVYNGSKYSIAASIGGGTRYRWVKLEFGSSPTLYVPRSRAEEVMLCLRYYWRIQQTNSDFNYFGGGIANASTNTYFTINLPVYMRDFPELGYGGNFQCYGGNGNFPIGSLAESPFTSTTDPIDDQTSTYTLMAVRNGGSQTAGHVYNLNGTTPGSYIEFDSEISEENKTSFVNSNAPAILFPYFRAYISTLTSLSGMQPVILPTINFARMLEQQEK